MERIDVSSTSIRSIGYDSDRRLLEVEFRSSALYRYDEVPDWAAEALITARSKGRHFERRIRDRYAYERVE